MSINSEIQRIKDEVAAQATIADEMKTEVASKLPSGEVLEEFPTESNIAANTTKMAILRNGIRNIGGGMYVTPQKYGAVGDGSTDDTAAFEDALAAHRIIFVPGGIYKLTREIVIRDNCQLELAQDAVLNFTNTTGNCITLNRSAFLKGNHATVNVTYAFSGRVINVDSSVHTATVDVPPWDHWSPQWKTARYLTDLNICKYRLTSDGRQLHDAANNNEDEIVGTAVYIGVDGSATSTFIWGMNFSGLRIAGAFEYGVRAVSLNSGYNHEMRIEAVMDAPKIGVSIENTNNAFVSAIVQPRKATDETTYAKHGIQLINSSDTDLTNSKVWDWNAANSLWSYDKTNVNQHIALYGTCTSTLISDYLYRHLPSGFNDIRELIYTDTTSNFDSLIILQEPFTRWFKPIDNEPYFDNGDGAERLLFKKEQDALFETSYQPTFTDVLATASDGAGGIFNEIGYKNGYYWETDGTTLLESSYFTTTGFIKVSAGQTLHVRGMSFSAGHDFCRVIIFDADYNKLVHVNRGGLINNGSYYVGYVEVDDGFDMVVKNPSTARYVKINVYTSTVSSNPVIAVDEEIGYTQVGTLTSGVKVNETNLIGMDGYEKKGRMTTQISPSSTDEQYPSAKAVYKILHDTLGAYVTDIAALVGGDA